MYGMSTRLYDDGSPKTKHIVTNPIIHVDDEARTATCRSYYNDTFQVVDGRWWFATRTLFVDLMGDLSQHLK